MCIRDRVCYNKRNSQTGAEKTQPVEWQRIEAVSYTHLDVYKRQAHSGQGEQDKGRRFQGIADGDGHCRSSHSFCKIADLREQGNTELRANGGDDGADEQGGEKPLRHGTHSVYKIEPQIGLYGLPDPVPFTGSGLGFFFIFQSSGSSLLSFICLRKGRRTIRRPPEAGVVA